MKKLSVLAFTWLIALHISAQDHQHHQQQQKPADTSREVEQHEGEGMLMSHAYSLHLPMSRNGSGTSWQPDVSPMYMYMRGNARSNWMIHGNIVVRYNKQDVLNKGSRGGSKVDAPNWFMGMYNRRVGTSGLFNATAMISFDPFTVGESGYPLLFQSGETYNGEKLIDRQHPHDLFSGLSVGYTQSLSPDMDLTGYFGYPGEPALGPVAFMHRVSSLNNTNAPLGHHWQDATHISFGVGTLGFRYKKVKFEGSLFNGREPDENRYNFDDLRFDSYSYRVSLNPTPHWAIQFSQGFLKSPEALEPGVDQVRTTVSIMNSASMRTMNWSHTLAWGMNDKSDHDRNENSILYETNLQFSMQALYIRYEYVKKSADELGITTSHAEELFSINALTLGYNRNVARAAPLDVLLGIQGTFNFPASGLKSVYGAAPIGAQVYLQLRPRRHQHF